MDTRTLSLDPLLSVLHTPKPGKGPLLLAIDGRAGSGKSTLAHRLKKAIGAPVIHMDDYYLRPAQRSTNRLTEPGGNIDYERFKSQVLDPLIQGEAPLLQAYRCTTNTFSTKHALKESPLYIIEGSYSLHPYFKNPYDHTVYLDVSEDIQRSQLAAREDPEKLKKFLALWVPLEDHYARFYRLKETVDFLAFNHQWVRTKKS